MVIITWTMELLNGSSLYCHRAFFPVHPRKLQHTLWSLVSEEVCKLHSKMTASKASCLGKQGKKRTVVPCGMWGQHAAPFSRAATCHFLQEQLLIAVCRRGGPQRVCCLHWTAIGAFVDTQWCACQTSALMLSTFQMF